MCSSLADGAQRSKIRHFTTEGAETGQEGMLGLETRKSFSVDSVLSVVKFLVFGSRRRPVKRFDGFGGRRGMGACGGRGGRANMLPRASGKSPGAKH